MPQSETGQTIIASFNDGLAEGLETDDRAKAQAATPTTGGDTNMSGCSITISAASGLSPEKRMVSGQKYLSQDGITSESVVGISVPMHSLVARVSSLQGSKSYLPGCPNQDSYLIRHISQDVLLVGVFDGHGREGQHISQIASDVFDEHAPELLNVPFARLGEEFERLFALAHQAVDLSGLATWSGTTATLALIDSESRTACIAHVGDSTLMISGNGLIEFLSRDHRIDEEVEQRIRSSGGEVRQATVSGVPARRIYIPGKGLPGLAMARALGDLQAQAIGVQSRPEVKLVPFAPGSTLVVCSDGVWDRVPPPEVADYLRTARPRRVSSALASGLVAKARERWPGPDDIDDITAIIVGSNG